MNDNTGSKNPHQYVVNLDRESQLNIMLEELQEYKSKIEGAIEMVELAMVS